MLEMRNVTIEMIEITNIGPTNPRKENEGQDGYEEE